MYASPSFRQHSFWFPNLNHMHQPFPPFLWLFGKGLLTDACDLFLFWHSIPIYSVALQLIDRVPGIIAGINAVGIKILQIFFLNSLYIEFQIPTVIRVIVSINGSAQSFVRIVVPVASQIAKSILYPNAF